jgi:hypothetical protein
MKDLKYYQDKAIRLGRARFIEEFDYPCLSQLGEVGPGDEDKAIADTVQIQVDMIRSIVSAEGSDSIRKSIQIIPLIKKDFEFFGDQVKIGRDEENDIVLDLPLMSKSHVMIAKTEGQYWIQDLGSTNKTFLNLEELAPKKMRKVKDGDSIIFAGSYYFMFCLPQKLYDLMQDL